MSSRAARRRHEKELQHRGLHRRLTALVIGDPASDIELLRLMREHEAELQDPTLSLSVRRELERSLERVRAMQNLLAELSPNRPRTAAEAH